MRLVSMHDWMCFDETERVGTRSDGRKQGRSSADGCDEDRALVSPGVFSLHGCPIASEPTKK